MVTILFTGFNVKVKSFIFDDFIRYIILLLKLYISIL